MGGRLCFTVHSEETSQLVSASISAFFLKHPERSA